MIGSFVVALRQRERIVDFQCLNRERSAPPSHVELRSKLREYFQLEVDFAALSEEWCAEDETTQLDDTTARPIGTTHDAMVEIVGVLSGMHILRQEPNECLFSFICSSNNNISRITLMLDRLRAAYGDPIPAIDIVTQERQTYMGGEEEVEKEKKKEKEKEKSVAGAGLEQPRRYYTFPSAARLSRCSEQELRDLGLGTWRTLCSSFVCSGLISTETLTNQIESMRSSIIFASQDIARHLSLRVRNRSFAVVVASGCTRFERERGSIRKQSCSSFTAWVGR